MYRDLYVFQLVKQHYLKMSTTERTFIAVKPDGVQRGLVSKITARFEERGYKLVGLKMVHASKEHLQVSECFGKLVVVFGCLPERRCWYLLGLTWS